MSSLSNPNRNFLNVMEFIDGGYLRKKMIDKVGHDNINFGKLRDILSSSVALRLDQPELIRAYYYDAIIEQSTEYYDTWLEQIAYFERIKKEDFYEVRLGRLVEASDGKYKQKGVDMLLAIDMVTKAYESYYDVAVLLAGDDDMVDLVDAAKDAGKRIYGAYFKESTSQRLIDSFDRRLILDSVIKDIEQKN